MDGNGLHPMSQHIVQGLGIGMAGRAITTVQPGELLQQDVPQLGCPGDPGFLLCPTGQRNATNGKQAQNEMIQSKFPHGMNFFVFLAILPICFLFIEPWFLIQIRQRVE